jgi:hypothetical protein
MNRLKFALFSLLISFDAVGVGAQEAKYPPFSEYLMPQAAEIALAKSAAPDNISSRATIKVLTPSGFQVTHEGDNGFVCMVMRGSAAPTFTPTQVRDLVYDAKLRAPICFNPQASETVMPYYELRNKLAMVGRHRMRSPKPSKQLIRKASCPNEMESASRTCGLRIRISDRLAIGIHI